MEINVKSARLQLNIEQYDPGIYFVGITVGKAKVTKKLVLTE